MTPPFGMAELQCGVDRSNERMEGQQQIAREAASAVASNPDEYQQELDRIRKCVTDKVAALQSGPSHLKKYEIASSQAVTDQIFIENGIPGAKANWKSLWRGGQELTITLPNGNSGSVKLSNLFSIPSSGKLEDSPFQQDVQNLRDLVARLANSQTDSGKNKSPVTASLDTAPAGNELVTKTLAVKMEAYVTGQLDPKTLFDSPAGKSTFDALVKNWGTLPASVTSQAEFLVSQMTDKHGIRLAPNAPIVPLSSENPPALKITDTSGRSYKVFNDGNGKA